MSWVDGSKEKRMADAEAFDADEAVVYPASVDMSWVDVG